MANFSQEFGNATQASGSAAPDDGVENNIRVMRPVVLRARPAPFRASADEYYWRMKDDIHAPGRKMPPLRAFKPAS